MVHVVGNSLHNNMRTILTFAAALRQGTGPGLGSATTNGGALRWLLAMVVVFGQCVPAMAVERPPRQGGGHSFRYPKSSPTLSPARHSYSPIQQVSRQASHLDDSAARILTVPTVDATMPHVSRPTPANTHLLLDPPADPAAPLGQDPQLEKGWSFNFQDAPWAVVLKNFAMSAGFSIQFLSDPTGTFSYYDEQRYSVRDAIDVFNDYLLQRGFVLIRDETKLTVASTAKQIPDNLVPYVSVHQLSALGRNEVASIALPLQNTDGAAEEIQQLLSPVGRVRTLSNSGRVIVTDTGTYLRRIRDLMLGSGIAAGNVDTVVVQLRHSLADDVADAINSFLSGNTGDQSQGAAPGRQGQVPNRVVAEKTTNSLLVRGSEMEISSICQIIHQLDRAPREVQVQALLVEVQLGNTHEFGVEIGLQDSVLFNRSVIDNILTIDQTTTTVGGTVTNQNIISQTAAPGFNFNNRQLGNNVAISPDVLGGQALSSFGVGRVNGDLGFGGLVLSAGSENVNVLLRALDANYNIDILSRPQIRTLENHEALIQVGQQVPVVDGVSVTAVGSANPVIRQDQAGIILMVTPRISPDGRVLLDVNAEKSAYNLTPGTGVPIFTDASNGNVIEAPIKDITTAETTVSIQSGETIVLGGMITEDTINVTRKVPWLGDIPLLGRAFRYDLVDNTRKELLVFLTPIVVENDEHSNALKHQEISRIHMPHTAWEFLDNNFHGFPVTDCEQCGSNGECAVHGHISADGAYQPKVHEAAGPEPGVREPGVREPDLMPQTNEPNVLQPTPVPGRLSGPVQPQEQASPPPIPFSLPPESRPLNPPPQSLSPAGNSTIEQPPPKNGDTRVPQAPAPRSFGPVPPAPLNGSQLPASPDVPTTLRRVPPQSVIDAASVKSQNGGNAPYPAGHNVPGYPRFGEGQTSPRARTNGVVNGWQPMRSFRGLVSGQRQGRSVGVAPINHSVMSETTVPK